MYSPQNFSLGQAWYCISTELMASLEQKSTAPLHRLSEQQFPVERSPWVGQKFYCTSMHSFLHILALLTPSAIEIRSLPTFYC